MSQSSDERATLLYFLQRHRDTFRRKCGGLTSEQLDTTHPPSTMTLGGMVKHLAYVENWWSTGVFLGQDPGEPWASVDWRADADWDWHSAKDDTPEQIWALYDAEVAAADRVYAAARLDDLAARTNHHAAAGRPNLRWILVHLIEEYAQHNGHADLIRESIDGQVN
ncbi:MAG TPA: DinB family protein [Nocardioides sp.]|uniref:DinB family protein n=1 Tax=Nocardioides sp. TaxID=35761 RepID=UPI002BBEAEE3|nr:DinB family protein [Nocardioides sp.]HTW17218.1 DinB family protein [Nocardioides sp.]